jgi:CsoR family transcriptional regulator, copper-sensing transcriptional repressor
MSKDPIEARMNRIEGQIKGVKQMYFLNKSCEDIVQQIQAVRAALSKVAGLLLVDEATRCTEKGKVKDFEKVVAKAFKTL